MNFRHLWKIQNICQSLNVAWMNDLAQFVNADLVNCVNLIKMTVLPQLVDCICPYVCIIVNMLIYLWFCIFAFVFTYMYTCVYLYYAYVCVYVCTLMLSLSSASLYCRYCMSAFHPHNEYPSSDSHRHMFLFVDCGTVYKIYHILF